MSVLPHISTSREPLGSAIPDDAASASAADRMLEESWNHRHAALAPRELMAGISLSVGFLLAAVPLALFAPHTHAKASTLMIVALCFAFAIASRVEFPVGVGYAVPTQLFLIPLLLLAPPSYVPLIVMAALAGAAIFDWLTGRTPLDRVVEAGTDSWHAVGPALVFIAAGAPGPGDAAWWLFVIAFLAQITFEIGFSSLRAYLGLGISPQLQLKVLALVWAVDILLTPAGAVGAAATPTIPAAPLAMLGVAAVLALLARDRNKRIEQATARLDALRRERSRLQIAVHRIGDAFASKLDLDALLTITTRAAVEALDADGGRASAHQGPGRKLVRRATVHEDSDLEPALRAAEDSALEHHSPRLAMVEGVWALACPITEPGDTAAIGMIVLARRDSTFAEEKQDLLRHLCEQAGVAAANIERHEALHRQALTDELTGLANHRRLQELLAQGVESHASAGTALALILFDLDDFKRVNDTRGHQTGDHVLRSASDALRDCCRTGDEPARYGGEELAIVVQGAAFAQVVALAERCRAAVAALELVDTEGRHLSVTTSVGVAELRGPVQDVPALISTADAALYRAKHAGKNCVRYGLAATNDPTALPPLTLRGN